MSFITVEGYKKIAAQQGEENGLKISHFVFANIPDLGDEPEDCVELLPDNSLIVHTQNSVSDGYVNENQVVYSVVLGSDIGDFTFNWVGLVDQDGVLIQVSYVTSQEKRKNDGAVAGNTLVRSFLIEYTGIQLIAGITVPAATWQLDVGVRFNGIDSRVALTNYDKYGHEGFIDDGYIVGETNSSHVFNIGAGVGYVGGVRVQSKENQSLTISTLPNEIWLNVSLQGDVSDMSVVSDFVLDTGPFDDYVDDNGINHYLTKIAEINAAGEVTDTRTVYETLQMHKDDEDPHHQYKAYAEEQASSALSAAKTDATTKANAALSSAKTYTDTKSASTLSAAKSDVTTKANAALASAKSHSNNASNLSSGTVPDARLPSDLVRTNEDGQEFGDETAFLGNQVFFGHNKEHNLFDNDGLGNAGIKLGCNKSVMTVDGGAVEFEADIDSESNPSWSISVSEGSQSIGDTVDWSDYQLKGKSDGTLTWGGKDVLTTGDLSLTGSIHFFATQAAPNGFVKCNGAAVSRTTYAALFSKIGTTFGAGNGTTTFNVPDLRGEFIRGWDNGRGVDSGRVFGSWQQDELKSHRHSMTARDEATSPNYMAYGNSGSDVTKYTDYFGGSETRPRNIALAAYIKY